MGGGIYIYIYSLPPAGGRFAPKVIKRLRRNHEWAEVWVDRWEEGWI